MYQQQNHPHTPKGHLMKTLRACLLLLLLSFSAIVRAQDVTPESTPAPEVTPEATEQSIEFPGPGSYTVRHRINGVERSYRVTIPASYSDDGDPLPLVIALHGAGGTGAGIESYSGFNALAEREGFIVAYPNGVNNAWNDGRPGSTIDDVDFIARMITFIEASLNIDPTRIYATGHSMGGMFSFRLGCELPERIAAIASVASTFPEYLGLACVDAPPVPVMIVQGTDDLIVPWVGIRDAYLSAGASLAYWAQRNGCTVYSGIEVLEDSDPDDGTRVMRERQSECDEDADVQLYGIYFGGHTWPGHVIGVSFELGLTSMDIDATEVIWSFFQEHSIEAETG